ncbi:CoA ester lyase [Haloquadratum walsbyi]|jgi:Citrate lyase beta subunit|uniref:Citrate lyase beta subunit n=1 Tax=Haloquadratum walsbyi J07HQW2 TaxID=1238425 RepID=U1MVJ1_9EURY|nr:CoA ester lyase [Haloquadratum walsbyi]ERG94404.1 MAG: citrate lyase beta subunit [Haloquadratum walsbyi J07HQW2]
MLTRSLLFCPGDEREMMKKAVESGADAVIFDLEDAVAPAAHREAHRETSEFIKTLDDPDPSISVRINPLNRGGRQDINAVVQNAGSLPNSVVLPKSDSAESVETLSSHLSSVDAESVDIIPLIETADGLMSAEEIATAPGVVAIAYGDQDYTADVGATVTDEKVESLFSRQRIVATAEAAGIDALDTVYTSIDDADGLQKQVEMIITFGFDGKLAIHPTQVDVINDAFTPNLDEIEWAETVIEGQRQAIEAETGVFTVDGQMIDPPLIERARTILDRATAAGIR